MDALESSNTASSRASIATTMAAALARFVIGSWLPRVLRLSIADQRSRRRAIFKAYMIR